MLGKLALTRTNLVALATLLALVAAMVVVLQSVQADGHEHISLSIGDSDNVIGDNQEVTLTVKVINVPDSDGNGANRPAAGAYSYKYVAIPSALPQTASPADAATFTAVTGEDDQYEDAEYKFFVPKGTKGEYSISVRVQRNTVTELGETETTPPSQKNLDKSITFEVGEAGTAISAATISTGKVGHATAKTAKTDAAATAAYGDSAPNRYEACADDPAIENDHDGDTDNSADDSVSANCIALTISVTNSLGNTANGGDVTAIHVFAPLATIIYDSDTTDAPAADTDDTDTAVDADTESGTAQLPGGSATAKIFITKMTPGSVEVTAIVLGKTGSTTSAPLTLLFTGSADRIALGEPDSALAQNGTAYAPAVVAGAGPDGIEGNADDIAEADAKAEVKSSGEARVEVTATDASGNVATLNPGQLGDIEITDANDKLVTSIAATPTQQKDAKGNTVHTAVRITLNATDTEPGTYTLSVEFGDNDPETVEIVVAGRVGDVALESSHETVAIGDIITVSATVSDAGGNLSPDVGAVMFQAVGSLKLNALGAGASGGQVSVDLDDGEAKARFVVVDGSGTATIIASTGGVDGVTSVATAAEEPEAMPAEEASLSCLSETNSFSTWTCEVDSSASEVFGWVNSRGASAIHLWNGSAWVRFSVVDGATVPGSSDFQITQYNQLYISN